MKKVFMMLVVTIAVISFTGCSDDDSAANPNQITGTIEGKWYPQGGTINGGEFEAYENECATSKDYQEFIAGQVKFVGYDASCEVGESNASAYTLEGNVLTVEDDFFGDMVFTIESLTAEKLILKSTYNDPSGMITEVAHFSRN